MWSVATAARLGLGLELGLALALTLALTLTLTLTLTLALALTLALTPNPSPSPNQVSASGLAALRVEFAVLGSTGNVYTVTICRLPSCSCVDHLERKTVCKHLLFVYHKVTYRTDPLLTTHRTPHTTRHPPPTTPLAHCRPSAATRPCASRTSP